MQNLRKTLGLDRKPQGQAPPKAEAKAAKGKGKKPETVEADANSVVTFACGHKIGVKHAQKRNCDGCCRKNQAARRTRYSANKRDKVAPSRLPDNSSFAVVYDAANTRWCGTLTINGVAYEGEHSGVFKLLAALDRMYRASLGSDEACPPPA
jgi:hypothetical protein